MLCSVSQGQAWLSPQERISWLIPPSIKWMQCGFLLDLNEFWTVNLTASLNVLFFVYVVVKFIRWAALHQYYSTRVEYGWQHDDYTANKPAGLDGRQSPRTASVQVYVNVCVCVWWKFLFCTTVCFCLLCGHAGNGSNMALWCCQRVCKVCSMKQSTVLSTVNTYIGFVSADQRFDNNNSSCVNFS